MSILDQLDKNNLHHAYLIEGDREETLSTLLEFLEGADIRTSGNADFMHINVDSFKMDDARNLKTYGKQKSFSAQKRIFVISANSILLEAQNSLLKIFEEPINNTHFFLIVPDANSLLKTLVSRFYRISPKQDPGKDEEIQKFLALPLTRRLDFIKTKLAKFEDEEEATDSARADAQRFLNSLEAALHQKMSKGTFDIKSFEQIFKARKYLRMPGSSVKNLMESVALIVPVI